MTEEELAAVPPWEEYVCPIFGCRMPNMNPHDCLEAALIAEGVFPAKYGYDRIVAALEGREGDCESCPYHPDSPQLEELEAWRAGRRSNTD